MSLSPLMLGLGLAAAAGLWLTLPIVLASLAVVVLAAAVAPLAVAVVDDKVRPALRVQAAGKAVLITGCDTGFGRMLALRLDSEGAHVFAGCLTAKGAASLREQASHRLTALELDVTKPKSIQAAVGVVREAVGGEGGLHGIVNNAGVVLGHFVELTDMEVYRRVMDVNFFGMVAVTKAFLPLARGGHVVNVTSVAGRIAAPGASVYSCSKHAGEAFTDALRLELPRGTSVSLVEPGFTRTPMTADPARYVRETYKTASPEVRAVYGDNFVERRVQQINKAAGLAMSPPEGVVEALCDALLSRVPKARYLVGADATLLYPWFWRLPSFVIDPALRFLESGSRFL